MKRHGDLTYSEHKWPWSLGQMEISSFMLGATTEVCIFPDQLTTDCLKSFWMACLSAMGYPSQHGIQKWNSWFSSIVNAMAQRTPSQTPPLSNGQGQTGHKGHRWANGLCGYSHPNWGQLIGGEAPWPREVGSSWRCRDGCVCPAWPCYKRWIYLASPCPAIQLGQALLGAGWTGSPSLLGGWGPEHMWGGDVGYFLRVVPPLPRCLGQWSSHFQLL